LGHKSTYLEEFLDIQNAFQEFKEYVDYIERLKGQKEIINLDALKQRSKEALVVLDKIGGKRKGGD